MFPWPRLLGPSLTRLSPEAEGKPRVSVRDRGGERPGRSRGLGERGFLLYTADLDVLDAVGEREELSADLDGSFPHVRDSGVIPLISDSHELAEILLGEGGHLRGVVRRLVSGLSRLEFNT